MLHWSFAKFRMVYKLEALGLRPRQIPANSNILGVQGGHNETTVKLLLPDAGCLRATEGGRAGRGRREALLRQLGDNLVSDDTR